MPLIFQDFIMRRDLRDNPDRLYLFGDNERRQGFGGQAAQCRGEPNAVGVATKRFGAASERAYWSDDEYARCVRIIVQDLSRAENHLLSGGTVVCPSAGLGTGLSQLKERAPRILERLNAELKRLEEIRPSPSS